MAPSLGQGSWRSMYHWAGGQWLPSGKPGSSEALETTQPQQLPGPEAHCPADLGFLVATPGAATSEPATRERQAGCPLSLWRVLSGSLTRGECGREAGEGTKAVQEELVQGGQGAAAGLPSVPRPLCTDVPVPSLSSSRLSIRRGRIYTHAYTHTLSRRRRILPGQQPYSGDSRSGPHGLPWSDVLLSVCPLTESESLA